MFQWGSLKLGRIKSIEINVHITWLIVFGLLIYWLRTGYVAATAPELTKALAWVVSTIGALVLFASVLAHELAHSLVASRNGLSIKKITLFVFGGVAHMDGEPQTPGVELKMAVAGPLASLAIAAILGFVGFVLIGNRGGLATSVVLTHATYANGMLALFNLVPGFPLDGGRVLRAVLWKITGNYPRSTLVAANLGRAFGLVLVFGGTALSVATGEIGFFWLVFVGSFLERLAFFSALRVRLALIASHRHFTYYEAGGTEPSEKVEI